MGLAARLALWFALVGVAATLLVGSASYISADRQVTAQIDQFLIQRADEISDGSRSRPDDRRDRKTSEQVVVSVSPDAEVQVLDENGEVVANSGLLLPVEDIDRNLSTRNGRSVLRTVVADGTDYRMVTNHLDGGGAIQVARSLDEAATLLDVLRTRTLATAAAIGALAALAGWVIAQRTTRPLRVLTGAVDEVATTRDFALQVPSSGGDEIGRLGDGFNRMLGALQQSQQQQRQLVQDAAHELRTPLTSLTANVDWLLRAPDADSQARNETLTGVRTELGELNGLIAEIIDLATDTHQRPPAQSVDLAAVAAAAVDRFRQRSNREVRLHTSPSVVLGDADSLDRAVTNLLSNADKYSPAGSPVSVVVDAGGLFVDDAGPGIPPSDRARVFDRFYRRDEDRSKPGSGLGLSIVASTVEQHSGSVVVTESALGGARVGFTLPAHSSDF